MVYVPGWGEFLAQNLQQIGKAIEPIVQPNAAPQRALMAAIQADPSVLNKLATVNIDQPGLLESVYGKNINALVPRLQETPQAQFERQVRTAGLGLMQDPNAREEILSKQFGTRLNDEREMAEHQLNERRRVAAAWLDLKQRDPDTYKQAITQVATGKNEVEWKQIQSHISAMEAAQPWQNASRGGIMAAIRNKQMNANAIQGLFDTRPDVMRGIFADLTDERNLAAQHQLARIAASRGEDTLWRQTWATTVKQANELGVKPAALFEQQFGFSPADVMPNIRAAYSPEDVNYAGSRVQQHVQQETAKRLAPLGAAWKELAKKPKDRTRQMALNTMARQAGVDIQVVTEEMPWYRPDRVQYVVNGQVFEDAAEAQQAAGLDDLLIPGREQPTTNAPQTPLNPNTNTRSSGSRTPDADQGTSRVTLSAAARDYVRGKTMAEAIGGLANSNLSERDRKAVMAAAPNLAAASAPVARRMPSTAQTPLLQSENANRAVAYAEAKKLTREQVLALIRQKGLTSEQDAILANLRFE